jgi:cytoskeletal protein CcmA (bactofilin family)
VKVHGKLFGSVETHHLIVQKRADVEFVRPIKVHSVEIHGKISARIMCETCVTITKGGALEGVVYAKAINIERGGIFSGELFIGQQELTQPELLGAGDEHPGLFGDETLGLGPA